MINTMAILQEGKKTQRNPKKKQKRRSVSRVVVERVTYVVFTSLFCLCRLGIFWYIWRYDHLATNPLSVIFFISYFFCTWKHSLAVSTLPIKTRKLRRLHYEGSRFLPRLLRCAQSPIDGATSHRPLRQPLAPLSQPAVLWLYVSSKCLNGKRSADVLCCSILFSSRERVRSSCFQKCSHSTVILHIWLNHAVRYARQKTT